MNSLTLIIGLVLLLFSGLVVFLFMFMHLMVKIHPGELAVSIGVRNDAPIVINCDGYQVFTRGVIANRVPRSAPFTDIIKMDIRPLELDFLVDRADTGDGHELTLSAEAEVEFNTAVPDNIHRPVEFFLGRPRQEVESTAAKIITSNIRDLVSQLNRDEINAALPELAENALVTAEADLENLGLLPRSLTIRNG